MGALPWRLDILLETHRRRPTWRVNGAYLRFSKSTGFSTVAEDRCEGALPAFQPLSRYAPIPEPEPNSLSTASRPPSSPLQAYYWPTSRQPVGNQSDVDPIHIGLVAPGGCGRLPVRTPLRTVLESFPSYGSCLSNRCPCCGHLAATRTTFRLPARYAGVAAPLGVLRSVPRMRQAKQWRWAKYWV